ncbi:hypothetical protein, partial [Cryobacterium sp. 10I5]|uniref:hypothetical protein n=1 Tax=Cryobacterium sp. 10I5 TaxID=3048581 RepID=UPI002B223290
MNLSDSLGHSRLRQEGVETVVPIDKCLSQVHSSLSLHRKYDFSILRRRSHGAKESQMPDATTNTEVQKSLQGLRDAAEAQG